MNKVVEAVRSGERVTTVGGDRFTGKTESILDAVRAIPEKSFLIISITHRDARVITSKLGDCKNFLSKDYHAVTELGGAKGYHPDIIIIDDFSYLYRIDGFDGSKLQLTLNLIKKEHTQLVRVG